MEMPFETKLQLEEMEKLIKEIQFKYMESARKECEPLIKAITSIYSMYPKPLMVSMEQLSAMAHFIQPPTTERGEDGKK